MTYFYEDTRKTLIFFTKKQLLMNILIRSFQNLSITLLFLFLSATLLPAQVVTVDPALPSQVDDVTITFDASEGNGALAGVSGNVYAHTGVITNFSSNGNDWQHVQGNWGTDDNNVRMTAIGNNKYTISYNINDFYGISSGEIVEQMAFVFRNTDGSVVGRAASGADIFTPVYPEGTVLAAGFNTPAASNLVVAQGDQIPVEGFCTPLAGMTLTDNGTLIAIASGTSINHTITANQLGLHEVVLTATQGGASAAASFEYTVVPPTTIENPPAGTELGVNVLDDNTVRLALYAPNKSTVFVLGSFNDFNTEATYQMKRSVDGTTYWLDIAGLDPDQPYPYQYLVDGNIKIADPYTPYVLDPANDNFIPAVTYPDLLEYPQNGSGILSVLQTRPPEYDWQVDNFENPAVEELVIYELLVRDFLERHDYQTLIDTLAYLGRLGINAIELMPVNEFEGNLSWGYNPSFHFAVDKYYGPVNELKRFVDEAHSRGIAVILDVVFNHAFSQSPLAQLYWDPVAFKPTAENPWLNPDARHPFNVGYDFNHESDATDYYVNRTLTHFLEEFRMDGFRFDLSKGFTQINSGGDVDLWGQYDASRIAILKDYADVIWNINPDAYAIMEHFAVNSEEKELADYGMLFWNNMNFQYNEATMGYNNDLTGADYQARDWTSPNLITFMESHDEERLMYKNLEFGNATSTYNVQEISTALDRVELASVFFYTIPGPKMLWQFGELGYDFSINYCPDGTINENCRVDNKPIRWDYLGDADRRDLFNVTRQLIYLKTTYDVFNTTDYQGTLDNPDFKTFHLNGDDFDVTALGNFSVQAGNITPGFPNAGVWHEYFTQDSLVVTNTTAPINLQPGEYRLYTSTRLEKLEDVMVNTNDFSTAAINLSIFPNPGNSALNIHYELKNSAPVHIEVVDLLGRSQGMIVQNIQNSGVHRHHWEHTLRAGIYFLNFSINGKKYSQRVVIN